MIAFVLAFLFRAFEAEAFVIPTGSMAPTLYGAHKDIHCEKCGHHYVVGASDDLMDSRTLQSHARVHSSVCPNCRYPQKILNDEIFKGGSEFKDNPGLKVTSADIVENPKKIEFAELDAAQLPRSLDDVDAAVINTNYAMEAGLHPKTDAIAIEGEKSPYANVIAVREADKDAPWVKTLVDSYHDESVKAFINEEFKGALIPSW